MLACPKCGHTETDVFNSRPVDGKIWRRRKCRRCEHRWTTLEIPAERLAQLERIEKAIAIAMGNPNG